MFSEPQWKSYNRFSGPTIIGTTMIPVPASSFTLDRQHWLTTKVETAATYGTIVMFDGTCVTAGPDQFILVYPAELANEDFNAADDQGLLGKLLARMFLVPDAAIAPKIAALKSAFAAAGWHLTPLGELRYKASRSVTVAGRNIEVRAGDLVHGDVLRDVITPIGGEVPRTGPAWAQSALWCRLFADLFSEPAGFATQDAFGRERLLKAYKVPRLKTPTGKLSVEAVVFGRDLSGIRVTDCGEELDLAMAVWYSNSVNAPAIAISCLERVLGHGVEKPFAARLIRALGTSTYGRWNASIPSGRYQRTRRLAMSSKLWSNSLFMGPGAIMPAQL